MPLYKTIATWIELSQGLLTDGPPKRRDYETVLFINDCELRETPNGKRYLRRTASCEFVNAATEDKMRDKVRQYVLREDVRMLAKGLDANDSDQLPRRVDDPSEEIINGTDDVYHVEPEPAAK
jgi:hypothetical protein